MKKLLARYREWRERVDNNGDGPIIWWPVSRFRVYIAPETWALPLSMHWEDGGEYVVDRATKIHEQGLVIGLLCLSCYIDLNVTTKVVIV